MAEKLHQSHFRVIIVGGSITGLTLANALSRMKIDFLVLETRDFISPCLGAAVCLMSHGTRILDQMGMLNDITQSMIPNGTLHAWQENGRLLSKCDTLNVVQDRHGYPAGWIDRGQLLQILLNQIYEKEKILLRKRFAKAEHCAEGIIAHCSDGSSFQGDIIIGADGVHSSVRQNMWQHMKDDGLEEILDTDETAMTAEYSCVYGVSKAVAGIEDGVTHRTMGRGFSFLLTPGTKNHFYWYLTVKMDKKYRSPHIPRYNKSEIEAHISRYLEQEVAPNIRLKSIYDNTTYCHYAPLEEATYEHWTWRQVVCLGDSIHKTTHTLGLGANTAIENAASLANCLASMIKSQSASPLSVETINLYLSSWASGRKLRAKAICISSSALTRFETLATWRHRIITLHLLPHLGDAVADVLGCFIVGSEGLDSIPASTRPFESGVPFINLDKTATASERQHLGVTDTLRSRLQLIALHCLRKIWG